MSDPQTAANPWRETVREIYDEMIYRNAHSAVARQVIDLIEERHPDLFCEPAEKAESENG